MIRREENERCNGEVRTGNPWIDKFGWFKDDPTFDDLETEIAAYRQKLDLEMAQYDK